MIVLYWLYAIVEELFSLMIVLLTRPLNLAKKAALGTKPGVPILLVHGYLHSSSAWPFFRYRLLKAGFGPIYTINLGSPFHSIVEYAQRVARKVAQIERETGRSTVILIGHSMGGLVCSYYALNMAPKNSVKAVVTLGSPLEGTKTAFLGFGPCAKEMRCDSKFIEELKLKFKENSSIPFLHLGSRTDLMIKPYTSALPNHSRTICQAWSALSHIAFLYRPDVATTVIRFLSKLK